MAGSGDLMFRAGITFDKEDVIAKDMSKILKNLQLFADGKPIVEKINFDTSGFKTFEESFKKSNEAIREMRKTLEKEFSNMPNNLKFTDTTKTNLTNEAQRLLDIINQLRVAEQTYAKTASQILKEREKAIEAEIKADEKAYQKWLQQKEKEVQDRQKTEDRKTQATQNAIARQNAEIRAQEEKRYQDYLNEKQREVQAEKQASDKKLAEQKKYDASIRQANHRRAMEAYQLAQTLRAQEDIIGNLTAKLAIYQKQISRQQVGTDAWNQTALEIRRISEELERSTQRMRDFQQQAFKGLSDTWVTHQVQQLTQWRAELDNIDKRIHEIQQARVNMGRPQYKEDEMNRLLDQRIAKTKQMNNMLTSAADLQLKREKEITAEKQRQEKIAAGNKAAAQRFKEENAILRQRENTINRITAKLQIQQQRLNSAEFGSRAFNGIIKEVERLTKKLQEAQNKINELTGKTTASANQQSQSLKKVTNEYGRQEQYLRNLSTRLAAYASIGALGGFLASVREVTAQFELQRVSLGAIIQDQNRANQLFSEIKSFALKSPVKILDLTKYVKQVAAYRIETDKLFDTTKRLADVSVGLGVDMQRIVLAYGQVKAASYLRAAEVRQFTEAGIPLLELLADKFTKVRGEMVSTADVMDMISKRGVEFSVIEDIFKDMTDAGGIFYNMQEKQGNTLFGMWAKLGDAASVMYDQIGNTESAQAGMRGLINILTDLMRNWKAASLAIIPLLGALSGGLLVKKFRSVGENVLNKQVTMATNEVTRAQTQLSLAYQANDKAAIANAQATLKNAQAKEKNAIATRNAADANKKFAAGWKSMTSSLLSGFWIGAAITAVTALVYEFKKAYDQAHAVNKEINKLRAETPQLKVQGVDNFIRLAEAAVHAANGSKEQKEALDELNRTYKDMLPQEALSIENLTKLRAGADNAADAYKTLTDRIESYIEMQQKQRELDFVQEHYGATQVDKQKKLRAELRKDEFMSSEEIERFFKAFAKTSQDSSKTLRQQFVQAMQDAGLEAGKRFGNNFELAYNKIIDIKSEWYSGFTNIPGFGKTITQAKEAASALWDLSGANRRLLEDTMAINKAYDENANKYGKYTKRMESYVSQMDKLPITNTILQERRNVVTQINTMEQEIRTQMQAAGLAWNEGWSNIIKVNKPEELFEKMSSIDFGKVLESIDPTKYPDLYNYIDEYQRLYGQLVPKDAVHQQIRAKFYQIVASITNTGVRDKLKNFVIGTDQDVKAHIKSLGESIEDYKAKVYQWKAAVQLAASQGPLAVALANMQYGDKIKETEELIEKLTELMKYEEKYSMPDTKKNKGTKSDTRLQELQEINQTLDKINKEYDEMRQKEGDTKALARLRKDFQNTLDYTNKISKKFGLHFDFPTEFRSLQQYREEILKVMKSLKNLKGGEKAILEFETMISKAEFDKAQKDIEKKLKELSERISQSKTAREFYDKILSQTGDVDIAASVTMSIYGDTGEGLHKAMAEQVRELFGGFDINVPVNVIADDNSIDYTALDKFIKQQEKLDEGFAKSDARKELLKIAQEGQKGWAKSYEGYLKDLEKAKEYSDKRIDLARRTEEKILEIRNNPRYSQQEKDRLIGGYLDKEAKELAKLEWEAFKDTPMYVQMFGDLEYASTTALKEMKAALTRMKGVWGESLDPQNLKEMQSRLTDIEKQLLQRNPFKGLSNGIQELQKLNKEYGSRKKALQELSKATATWLAAQERLNKALQEERVAKNKLNANKRSGASQDVIDADEKALAMAKENVKIQKQSVDLAKRQADSVEEVAGEYANVNKNLKESAKSLLPMLDWAGQTARAIADISEAMGADANDVQYFNDIADGLESISAGIQDIVNAAMSGDVIGVVTSALTAIPKMIVGFIEIFNAGKIRRANKEIEKQEKILHDLEYRYDRLQKAQEKLFGTEYIQNYRQQISTLKAEAAAYKKQADAERSKGKKADKDAIKDYEDSWRDTMDEIKDMRDDLQEYMLGTDLTSAARDFANSWLEARWAFEDTTEAMKEKFADMVQNMIVEMTAARLMEGLLEPMFKEIDRVTAGGRMPTIEELTDIAEKGYNAIGNMNIAMESMLSKWQEAGLDLSKYFGEAGELTGISRDIATASEESINGLAQGINTQNFYMFAINENVAAIKAYMEGGSVGAEGTGMDLISLQNEHLSQLPMIEANTRLTAERAERAAIACEEIASAFGRVLVPRGNGFALRTEL